MAIIRNDNQNYSLLSDLTSSIVVPRRGDQVYIEGTDSIYLREPGNILPADGNLVVEQVGFESDGRWIAIQSGGGSVSIRTFDFTATAGQTVFTLLDTPLDDTAICFVNNQGLDYNDEFTISGTTLTYTDTSDYVLEEGDNVHGYYFVGGSGGSTGGGVVSVTGNVVDNTDPLNPIVKQVSPDWNATTGLGLIANKPTIPAAQIQSDWNQTNNTLPDFIKNKPIISAGANIYNADGTIDDTTRVVTMNSTANATGLQFVQGNNPSATISIYNDIVTAGSSGENIESGLTISSGGANLLLGTRESTGPGDTEKGVIEAPYSDMIIQSGGDITINGVTDYVNGESIFIKGNEVVSIDSPTIGKYIIVTQPAETDTDQVITRKASNGNLGVTSLSSLLSTNRFTTTITPVANTKKVVTHSLNNSDVIVQVRDAVSNEVVSVEIEILSANTVGITSTTTDNLRVVVL